MRRGSRHSARRRSKGSSHPHYAAAAEEFRVPASASMPKRVFTLCHYCGYTPTGSIPQSGVCPKCHYSSWERYALPEPLIPAHMK